MAGNWNGDGQSTFLFDTFARQRGGWVFSIDINLYSIETARRACSHSTQFINNDSVAALNALSATMSSPVGLLYRQLVFDLDLMNATACAVHHALELLAARPLLGPGAVVAIDDYGVGGWAARGRS